MKFSEWPMLTRDPEAIAAECRSVAGRAPVYEVKREVLVVEVKWRRELRPYYSVYPIAMKSLLKINVDRIDCSNITFPVSPLLIRLPEGEGLAFDDSVAPPISSMLCHAYEVDGVRHLVVFMCHGMFKDEGLFMTAYKLPLDAGTSIGEQLDNSAQRSGVSGQAVDIKRSLSLVAAISLLDRDPDIIEPDVLDKDRIKYAETKDPAIVARAVRRGKRGWTVGAHLNTSPHYRRPHFALRWTGVGRAVGKIVPVKGAIVKRLRLSDVPTGYLGPIDQPPPSPSPHSSGDA